MSLGRTMSEAPSNKSGNEHSLSDISGFPPEMIEPLATRWIQTGEELLALAVAPTAEAGLAELLGIDQAQLTSVMNCVREALGPECVSSIESRGRRGGPLGVRFTDEQKRRMGLDDENEGGPDL